jgi:tetratricopeptide (TPR) repeat protein
LLGRNIKPWTGRQTVGVVALVSLIVGFGVATHARNQVFLTWDSYWKDVVEKAPSWRAHTNLGWSYQGQGKDDLAEPHFKEALRLAPLNYLTSSNLGALYSFQGKTSKARRYHDIAVGLETYTTIGLEARAEHFLATESYPEALADLQRALPRTMKPREVHQRLAQANAGLGDWQASLTHTLAARDLGRVDTANQITRMVRPFWASREQALRGIQYFSALDGEWPDQWWVHANWSILAEKTGDTEAAHQQREIANKLRPEQ